MTEKISKIRYFSLPKNVNISLISLENFCFQAHSKIHDKMHITRLPDKSV